MSFIIVNINDETATGKIINTVQLEFPESLVTVAEIIEKRVVAEVNQYNKHRKEYFNGLVQPAEAEVSLNGYRVPETHTIDLEKQVKVAKEAFVRNAFFMLIDQLQAETLDQTFLLHPESKISFVKLTPLVGG